MAVARVDDTLPVQDIIKIALRGPVPCRALNRPPLCIP